MDICKVKRPEEKERNGRGSVSVELAGGFEMGAPKNLEMKSKGIAYQG